MVDIIHCEQGSDEWHSCRLGIPTASEFGTILAKGQGKTRATYMRKLVGERITGEVADSYTNHHMERGHIMEEEARTAYAFLAEQELIPVGFVRNGDIGASPDALVGAPGLLEIKTKLPHLQIAVLEANKLPPEHKPQVQGQIMVCEREWCDFVSYWPKLPPFVHRVYRDDDYIKMLRGEIDRFLSELSELEAKIRSM